MSQSIAGRVYVVTGASRGFGLAIAQELVSRGARVGLLARDEERLAAAVAKLGADKALAVVADITDSAAVQAAMDAVAAHFGGIDGLVNNAGRSLARSLEETSPDDFASLLPLNLVAPAMVASIDRRQASEQTEEDYRIRKGLTIREEISTAFRVGQSHFDAFAKLATPSVEATRRFIRAFLQETFGFDDLEPGTYFLKFSKPGWGSTQASNDVVAGDSLPAVMKVQMMRLPGTEPFASYLHYQGYIGCAFKAANFVFPNSCEAVGDPDQYDILNFDTNIVPEVLQSEIVWKHTQEIGSQMGTIQYVEDAEGERQRIGNVWGPSPLVCKVTKTEQCTNSDGTGGGGAPLNETGFPGRFYASVYTACYPQCIVGAVGAGVILQQEYDLYATAFFNYAPPEGWTLQTDGQFDPPS